MQINTLLSADNFEYLSQQQGVLDADIRKSHNISEASWTSDLGTSHLLALRVEIAELINEAHDAWKYWKKKPVNKERIIDEAVDVIHFAVLHLNKDESVKPSAYAETIASLDPHPKIATGDMDAVLLTLSLDRPESTSSRDISDYILYTVSLVLQILDVYEFTTADIMDAYDVKNKENFKRITDGY